MARTSSTDVVIVGGGIAGGALAVQLSRAGIDVLVLEESLQFRDRVRGETMPPWGYTEAVATGLLPELMRAEGTIASRSVPYGDQFAPAAAEAAALDLGALLPDTPGMLNLSHPKACQALLDTAASEGAEIVRGARSVQVTAGPAPSVRFRFGEQDHQVRTRLVVGADGRTSVVRRQLGLDLRSSGVRSFALGLLVDGVDEWPTEVNALGSCHDVFFLLFPRRDGRLRIYLIWDKNERGRFAGRTGAQEALQRLRTLDCFPDAAVFDRAQPVPGSWASFPMDDTWLDHPYTEGAVLIGDAAGYNDPVIGQGLSIALRDSRLVTQALTTEDGRKAAAFVPYATERAERMRRLRCTAEATTRLRVDFSERGRLRRKAAFARFAEDPSARLPLAAALVGPERIPAQAFEPAAVERMLALA